MRFRPLRCLSLCIQMAVLTDEGSAATWLFGLGRSRHSHVDGGAGGHRMLLGGGGRALEEAPKADWVLDSRNTAAEAISARANIAGGDGVIGKSAGVVSLAGEFSMLRSHHNYVPLMAVSLSCLFGLGISFFGFAIRRRISATGFTVMGCTNKLLTLLVNTLVWTHHASLPAQGCVLISIAGGVLYGEFSKADADMKKIGGGKAVLPMGKSEGGIPVSVKAGAGADRCGHRPSAAPGPAPPARDACCARACSLAADLASSPAVRCAGAGRRPLGTTPAAEEGGPSGDGARGNGNAWAVGAGGWPPRSSASSLPQQQPALLVAVARLRPVHRTHAC